MGEKILSGYEIVQATKTAAETLSTFHLCEI